jgi:xanthine phosphoribosyltransferase
MEILEECIKREAKHLGNGIVKVDSFMNHQLDPALMKAIGEELAKRFVETKPTRILTSEASGIAPALVVGMCLNIPIVYARKHQPITMSKDAFQETLISPTHGLQVELSVSAEYLTKNDRVLIIDDLLSSSTTTKALVKLVQKSGATLVGIGAVIEKAYAHGREMLEEFGVPIEALAVIERCEGDHIILQAAD